MAGNNYNQEQINACASGVQSGYDAMIDQLVTGMQTNYVNFLVENWEDQNAVKYVEGIVTDVNGLKTKIDQTFESIKEAINAAVNAYNGTSGNSLSTVNFSASGATINDGGVQAQLPDGSVGWIADDVMGPANTAKGNLGSIKSAIDSACSQVKSACANSGFNHSGVQAQIDSSINEISQSINKAFSSMEEMLNQLTNQYATNYEETAHGVSTIFSVQ